PFFKPDFCAVAAVIDQADRYLGAVGDDETRPVDGYARVTAFVMRIGNEVAIDGEITVGQGRDLARAVFAIDRAPDKNAFMQLFRLHPAMIGKAAGLPERPVEGLAKRDRNAGNLAPVHGDPPVDIRAGELFQ